VGGGHRGGRGREEGNLESTIWPWTNNIGSASPPNLDFENRARPPRHIVHVHDMTHTHIHTHTHTHTYTHITTRMYTYVYARGPRANHNNVLHARMGPARRQQLVNELSVTLRCKHKKELSTWQPVMIWTRSYR
jgi:hypothetical protein